MRESFLLVRPKLNDSLCVCAGDEGRVRQLLRRRQRLHRQGRLLRLHDASDVEALVTQQQHFNLYISLALCDAGYVSVTGGIRIADDVSVSGGITVADDVSVTGGVSVAGGGNVMDCIPRQMSPDLKTDLTLVDDWKRIKCSHTASSQILLHECSIQNKAYCKIDEASCMRLSLIYAS